MCPELRPLLAGLPRADSLTLNPHKGLSLPYGTGALLVRDGEALRAAHAAGAAICPMRRTRASLRPERVSVGAVARLPRLRVWLPLSLFGTARFRAALLEKRALALDAAGRVAELPGVALVAPPQLSLFAFHLHWPGSTREQENDATGDLMRRVTARGRVMLTGARVGERFLGRVCVLAFRTRKQHVDACVGASPRNPRQSSPSGRTADSWGRLRPKPKPGGRIQGMQAAAADARQDADLSMIGSHTLE